MFYLLVLLLGFLVGFVCAMRLSILAPGEWAAVQEVRLRKGKDWADDQNQLRKSERQKQIDEAEIQDAVDKERIDNNQWPIFCVKCVEGSSTGTLCSRHMKYLKKSCDNEPLLELPDLLVNRVAALLEIPLTDISDTIKVEKITDGTIRREMLWMQIQDRERGDP